MVESVVELEEGVDTDFVSPLFESDVGIRYIYKSFCNTLFIIIMMMTSYAPIELRNIFR